MIGDEGLKLLAPVLENSDIMYIDLGWNNIESEGAKYFSKFLRNSKIISLDLSYNIIQNDAAEYLADGLRHSQVCVIYLFGNEINNEGYLLLTEYIDDTNLTYLLKSNTEGVQAERTRDYVLTRNTISIASRICHLFDELVSFNLMSEEFEFILPRMNIYPPVNIDDYAFFIRIFNDNPNLKVHIFDMKCIKDNGNGFDFNMMTKINEFTAKIVNKFNTFINNNLPEFVQSYGNSNYVNVVKQFEDIRLYDVVENLLLHRIFYYVDENEEILHPYIYKMLHKYNLPLYNEQLEPNKKQEIISYYQCHQEIDGIEEIIDLLRLECFN